MSQSQIVVSTDGSALGNPNGPMGWAWADHEGNASDAGGATNGTNQIGELCAVLQALRTHRSAIPLTIQTDSQYAINCSTKWVHGWKKKGWKNAAGKPVKNRELIESIDRELQQREGPVTFLWVKGHAGDEFNEKVDNLARTYAEDVRAGSKHSYLPIEGWQSLLASPYTKGLKIAEEVRRQLSNKDSAEDDNIMETQIIVPLTSVNDETEILDPIEDSEDVQQTQVLPTISEATEQKATNKLNKTKAEAIQETAHQSQEPKNVETLSKQTADETNNSETTRTNNDEQSGRGLLATGDITITPPPSQSSYFAGKSLHISGSISFDADIDQEGRVHITSAPFLLHSVNTIP